MRKPFLHTLHDYFFPHERNNHHPHIFRAASVALIIIGVLAFEGAYLAQIKFVFPHTNFLGAVLPGALVALTNEDRMANGLAEVTHDALLDRAAQAAAEDMAANSYFAHISPDGKDPWYWLNLVGYKYSYAGENLAVNFTDSKNVQSAWMESPTHRSNIMKREYTSVGFGTANGMYEGKETTFVVSFFASPETSSSQSRKSAPVASTPKVAVATSAPVSAEMGTTAPVAEVLGIQAQVAAVSVNPSPIAGFFAMAATSPMLTMTYILSALAIIVLVLLIIAIVVRARAVYIETIAGGLILLIVIIGLLFFNIKSAAKVQVSDGSQSATVGLSI